MLFLILNAATCLMMTGIIWLIQILHYPTFSKIGKNEFVSFHEFHTSAISMVVIPLMLVELITAFYLTYQKTPFPILLQVLLGLVLLIWLSTFLIQVPTHQALSQGFNQTLYDRLILSNWIRTLAWSMRSVILCYIIYKLMLD